MSRFLFVRVCLVWRLGCLGLRLLVSLGRGFGRCMTWVSTSSVSRGSLVVSSCLLGTETQHGKGSCYGEGFLFPLHLPNGDNHMSALRIRMERQHHSTQYQTVHLMQGTESANGTHQARQVHSLARKLCRQPSNPCRRLRQTGHARSSSVWQPRLCRPVTCCRWPPVS